MDQCAPPYYPKFRNGWEPPAEFFRAAPWETEGSSTGPPRSPTSPDYRQHTPDDVSVLFIGLSVNTLIEILTIENVTICLLLQFYGSHSSSSSNG